MLLIYLLRWLGLDNKYITTVRPGVLNFAIYSVAGLLLFIIIVFVGSYLGWVH